MPSSIPKPGESLADLRPDLAAEWNTEKNGELNPWDVKPGSGKKVWWKCKEGHIWKTRIADRKFGNGCPFCGDIQRGKSKSKPKDGESLADIRPDLVNEWYQERNGDTRPTNVQIGSHKKVWWRCSKGHEWEAVVRERAMFNTNCPYCAPNGKVAIGENDLATTHPQLALEWHPIKNGELKPTGVRAGSHKKVWWKCSKGHEWEATVNSRTNICYNNGCPYCSAHSTSYPEQYIYWALKQIYSDAINRFRTKNKVEYDIFIPSIKLAIEYSGNIWHEGKEERDKYKRELAESNGIRFIDIIEDRDCISSIIQDNHFEYSPKKNREESLQSIIEIIIKQYNHLISEIDFDKVKKDAIGYSKGKIEYEKSFEYLYPGIAKEWDYEKNNQLTPKDVTHQSHMKVWWKCTKGHEWQATVAHRSIGRGCPHCYNLRRGKKSVQPTLNL